MLIAGGSPGHSPGFYSERKTFVWMKNAFRKITLPGQTVPDSCASALATVRSCMSVPRYRRLVRCKSRIVCSIEPSLGL